MRILLVEDEDVVRELLAEELARQGHEVQDARDCAGALSKSFRPELLIADVKLPDGSGVELMGVLQKQNPGLRVMLMSGYDRERLPAGVHYLRKPFRMQQFRQAVKELL